jgi:hypothetical protein
MDTKTATDPRVNEKKLVHAELSYDISSNIGASCAEIRAIRVNSRVFVVKK